MKKKWSHTAAIAGILLGLGGALLLYLIGGGNDIVIIIVLGLGGLYVASRSALWLVRNHTSERRKGSRRGDSK